MSDTGTLTYVVLTTPTQDQTDAQALARRVCQACLNTLGVDGAAISLSTASSARETLWATDPIAELIENLQFSLGEGVCVTAAHTGSPVLVHDLRHDTQTSRWPVFMSELAPRAHIQALFGLPLQWGTTTIGVLDLYRRTPGPLTDTQLSDTLTALRITTTMLLNILTSPHTPPTLEDLPDHARADIHLAVGTLMAELHTSAADALARLRAHAFTHHQLVTDIAPDIIAGRLHLTPHHDPPDPT